MNRLFKIRALLLPLCLGLWGCLLLKLYLSGQISQMQNPAYHTITLGFSVFLLIASLALPFLFDCPAGGGKLKEIPSLVGRGVLLILPVIAYLLLPLDFSATTFLRQRSGSALLSPGAMQRFLPGKPGELRHLLLEQVQSGSKDQTLPLDLLELIYLSQDPELRRHYDGQRVSIPGQWLAGDAGHFKIARLLIFCCAADGRTITLNVNGKTDLKEDGVWIEITGTLHFKAGVPVPELELIEYRKMEGPPDAGM